MCWIIYHGLTLDIFTNTHVCVYVRTNKGYWDYIQLGVWLAFFFLLLYIQGEEYDLFLAQTCFFFFGECRIDYFSASRSMT